MNHISPRGLKITYLYSIRARLKGETMANRCFCLEDLSECGAIALK